MVILFEKPISMPINHIECSLICNRHMVETDANDFAIFPVGPIDRREFLAPSCTQSNPEITELGDEWTWDF